MGDLPVDNDVINLRDQVAVLRRRWLILVVSTLLALGAALAYVYTQQPMYSATAELLVSQPDSPESRSGLEIEPEEIATQVQVIQSQPVAEQVIETLGLEESAEDVLNTIEVQPVDATRVLQVSALRASPAQAADLANAFADAYLSVRETQATTAAQLTETALNEQVSQIRNRLRDVQAQLDSPTGDTSTLEAEEQALFVQLTQAMSFQATAAATTAASQSSGQVLVQASVPGQPAQPKIVRTAALGAILGLMIGVGLAFVRDHFDDAIRDEARLKQILHHRPVLGRIPRWSDARSGRVATIVDPHAPVSEAYRSLSSSVRFLLAAARPNEGNTAHRDGRILLISSAGQGEGKTTVASNLAVAAARFGLRVVLVDADLRKPGVAIGFGMGNPPGLSDALADGDGVDSYLLDVGVEGLQVLAAGSIAPNPAELLASTTAAEVLRSLADGHDLVIVDSAPVTLVADTLELIPTIDLVLLVVRHGLTHLRAVADTIERIRQVGGTVSGAIYNHVDSRGDENAYSYGAPTGRDEQPKSTPTKDKLVLPARESTDPTADPEPIPAGTGSRPATSEPGPAPSERSDGRIVAVGQDSQRTTPTLANPEQRRRRGRR